MKIKNLLVLLLFLGSCGYREATIQDVSKHQELLLFPIIEHPTHAKFRVIANTDSGFVIRILQKRISNIIQVDTYRTYTFKNSEIDSSFGGDWYADTLFLDYQPLNTKVGFVKINYQIQ